MMDDNQILKKRILLHKMPIKVISLRGDVYYVKNFKNEIEFRETFDTAYLRHQYSEYYLVIDITTGAHTNHAILKTHCTKI